MNATINKNGWNLTISGTSEVYITHRASPDAPAEFVARFKYARPGTCAKSFASFIAKNITPAAYFGLRVLNVAPGTIAEAAGWVNPNLRGAPAGFVADALKRARDTVDAALHSAAARAA